jgi:SAM-dependent methyltransferase
MALVRRLRERLAVVLPSLRFRGSAEYWEERYARGGTSGAGSYGEHAAYKSRFLNQFVADRAIESVIEFGCGDGNQLRLAEYPRYMGLDVSETALRLCREQFADDPSKTFIQYDPASYVADGDSRAELGLSLDVIYHLVEDEAFESHMRHLFGSSERYVIVYATDTESPDRAPHVRRRVFTDWVERERPDWNLDEVVRGPAAGYQNFYVFSPRAD